MIYTLNATNKNKHKIHNGNHRRREFGFVLNLIYARIVTVEFGQPANVVQDFCVS
jgi:hypothetical protein